MLSLIGDHWVRKTEEAVVVGSSLIQGSSSQCFYFKHYLIWMYASPYYLPYSAKFSRCKKFSRFLRKFGGENLALYGTSCECTCTHTMQLYEAEMADVMHKEYEKATELEKVKEEEKSQQSIQYQEQLERQLEEQVCGGEGVRGDGECVWGRG